MFIITQYHVKVEKCVGVIDMNKRKVLVVDDKEVNRKSASLLKDAGYNVTTAGNFVEGVEALGLEPFRPIRPDFRSDYFAVLTDLMMPVLPRDGNYTQMANSKHSPCYYDSMFEESTAGYPMAMVASTVGVLNIAILTDMNHHAGPDVAVFDMYRVSIDTKDKDYGIKPVLILNESKLLLLDERDVKEVYLRKDGKCDGFEERRRLKLTEKQEAKRYVCDSGYPINVKNWLGALEMLLGKVEEI